MSRINLTFLVFCVVASYNAVAFRNLHATQSKISRVLLNAKATRLYQAQKWSPGLMVQVQKKNPDYMAFVSYIGATATQFSLILVALHLLQIVVFKKLPNLSFTLPAMSFLPFWNFSLKIPSILFNGGVVNIPSIIAKTGILPSLINLQPYTFPALAFPSLAKVTGELALGRSLQNLIVFFLMLFMAVRSRVFSPLDNSRPTTSNSDPIFKGRLRPWFQPPGIAFPFIWSTIAFLRAISATIVFNTTNTLLCNPIFALMLHLSIGDTWNTINNVERRMGTATLVVPMVLASAAFTLKQMSLVSTTAAYVISPMVLWLTIANCLVYSIWKINYALAGRPSLFPSVEEGPPAKWKLPFTSLNK